MVIKEYHSLKIHEGKVVYCMDNKLLCSSEYAAYIPCYKDGNAVTAIKKDGGTSIIERGIKSLIRNLLKENSLDIHSIRKNFSDSIGRRNIIPVPLGLDTVLIPVKVRKAIAANDGSFAYIDLSYIKGITGDKNSIIGLTCGPEISCLESVKTVKQRVKMGDVVMKGFTSRMMGEFSIREGISQISSEYGRAATKEDIILLAYEIMKLRNRMER